MMARVLAVDGPAAHDALALELFRLHAAHNHTYRAFLEGLRLDPATVRSANAIPFLPIGAFKRHRVVLEGAPEGVLFRSSGTTGQSTSTHHVAWPAAYEASFMAGFQQVFGDPRSWRILALLPSYLERDDSSLVYMAEHLIRASGDPLGGTYLHRYDALADVLRRSEAEGRRTLLLGVTFALLDLAEQHPMPLRHVTIIETGGMKGRRAELLRTEVHERLAHAFGVAEVGSEYGMTELLSQAWSLGRGIFHAPPWMRISIREVNDPFAQVAQGRSGGINVTDLANFASCPFIATDDLGRLLADGGFEVLGRFDHSGMRGCNLMVEG